MYLFDDLDFLELVKQMLEERIKRQEEVINAEKLGFYDKQLNYELTKELHKYEEWLNYIDSYIINKTVFGGGKYTMKKEELIKCNQSLLEQNRKLLESNKMLSQRIEELEIEIDFLNREIMQLLQLLDENNL